MDESPKGGPLSDVVTPGEFTEQLQVARWVVGTHGGSGLLLIHRVCRPSRTSDVTRNKDEGGVVEDEIDVYWTPVLRDPSHN